MPSPQQVHLWLRAETKRNERRTALTPSVCEKLVKEEGFVISVESCKERIFKDHEYVSAGCTIVPSGTWTTAPTSAYIVALKELPTATTPLRHTHIFFAHCYKKQAGWSSLLSRFHEGNGTILDLEFLTDVDRRRVAAFGYHAGFAGAALGLDAWAWRILEGEDRKYPSVRPYETEDDLVRHVQDRVRLATEKRAGGSPPVVMVMGALGRCGSGATNLAVRVGVQDLVKWDMKETKGGGPFPEIVQADVFVNCIYLVDPIPPFLTMDTLETTKGRRLTVLVDVSCDTTNPNNPIPLYDQSTTFHEPTIRVDVPGGQPLDVITIDHLPSLVPREASEMFCDHLLPSLRLLKLRRTHLDDGTRDDPQARVWTDAEDLFRKKSEEALVALASA
ncbi:Saccharopine dehydrogenase [Thoreauomyces humboldtii]|nr:Saccharopine dehydrogenase [Thoreauomyces humboldtii]